MRLQDDENRWNALKAEQGNHRIVQAAPSEWPADAA